MQITIQMLDGSVIPFRVRSSITIASLKAKFEPWQPMKGRALLHHDVQLEDRAALNSVAGVKNGTILRVDNRVSQVKSQTTRKNLVMSGPASSAVDEDVQESIETSGDDEEISSDNERRILTCKRKRPSRTSATAVENSIDDEGIANSPPGMALSAGDTRDNSRYVADASLNNSQMTLRSVKKEKTEIPARGQADKLASGFQPSCHRQHAPQSKSIPPPEKSVERPPSSAHAQEAFSARQQVMEADDGTFLSGLHAAIANTETLPLNSRPGPEGHHPARRCHTCGRACGCGAEEPLIPSSTTMPTAERIRSEGTSYINSHSDSTDHPTAESISSFQH